MTDGFISARFSATLGRFSLDAALEVPARGVIGLFGPSGCGKTTVLRAIAGLLRLDGGGCIVDGAVWQDGAVFLPPHRRPVGYVFQEASLFPHLCVRDNLLFGAPTRRSDEFFDEIVDMLALSPLLGRSPQALSGGERQRVAIGRALLSRPRLLLMDEPLSALDQTVKANILPFLEQLIHRFCLPVLYVSHDMREIERLADHLVLMADGRVVASGPIADVQSDVNAPISAARDAAVTLFASVVDTDRTDGLMAVRIGDVTLLLSDDQHRAPRSEIRLRIGAGDVSLARSKALDSSILNIVPATVVATRDAGESELLAVLSLSPGADAPRILARITMRSWKQLGLRVGDAVFAQVKGVSLHG